MNFDNKLIPGTFVKRYKRFFADVKFQNKIITVHCANSGSMMGLLKEGSKVWFTKSHNLKRKLKYTLQIIEHNGSQVGVNTHFTNKIVNHALQNNLLKYFSKKTIIKNEQKFGLHTRFDFYLEDKSKKIYLEVKNVTLKRTNRLAEFPDSVTTRGTKHLNELVKAKKMGFNACLLYVIQREDCDKFAVASDIDLEYSKALKNAVKHKVKIICYDCKFSSKGIKLNKEIKLQFNDQ
jgi:sugar fermentation stimulation protein A